MNVVYLTIHLPITKQDLHRQLVPDPVIGLDWFQLPGQHHYTQGHWGVSYGWKQLGAGGRGFSNIRTSMFRDL